MEQLIQAIILGIIEGLTEFLPVSSTGHLILAGEWLGFVGESSKTFKIVIQLGAVLAVLVLYWSRFVSLAKDMLAWRFFRKGHLDALHIALALLPAVVLGFLLHGLIKQHLFGPEPVLYSLVAGGILMIIAERTKRRVTAEEMDDLSYRQALGIGCFQCLALWPGFSRSGSTISGGLLLGTSQKAAAEFTFIISVPIMLGASLLDLYESRDVLSSSDLPVFLVGLAASFIVAMLAVVTFINLIKRLRLTWFALYRFVLAAVFYFFVLM
ncbi:undecaprenyl-diphosphate phosphatase [Paenibacillus daejeonensis]|uniref:undecaprenyl-diphosphate phosphatase n=1 Tax=Paenibacillus daejeonensis TaxID=135193 RepID=UPI0003712F7B|nr:undecaprenyl-diphosphate phosphatase [Paenibacillus daejeonensis]